MKYPLGVALLTLSTFAVTSCAKERDPIDRTQPNALKKAFFVGDKLLDSSDDPEFYAQGTLIDVGYGAAQDGLFTSTYAQPVSRIKWVIQENELVGRITYERIDDSDGKGAGPASTDGVIAYVYPIISHFDIRRSYNPVTGEEINVIEENQSDRPWYEREYMRVDWSQNQNTDSYDFDTLSQMGVFGGVEYENLSYYVNDPTHPDAPHFAEEDGYFDVTNKAFAKPKEIDLSYLGWGIDKFPACYLPADFAGGTDPAGNCNPVELTIRQSFRKITDTDYEPAQWDGFRFQAFGAFYTERKGYARNYGMSDDKWRRLIDRYNIWGLSHAYSDPTARTGAVACFTPDTTPRGADPHRDLDNDGTEDECASVGEGSRCDEFNQKCTLPYRQRPVRPIVWYYTNTSDLDYFEASAEAAQQWDIAMRAAVQTARYAECMRVKKDQAACVADHPMHFGQQAENDDMVALSTEVDDCRYGRAYQGQDCNAVADSVGAARGYSAGVIALAKLPEMVVLCHSPVIDADSELCGERGLVVRQGDLRYHQINVIPIPQTPSPWGIYTDAHDPLTGETISASVNVWSFVNDLFSQGVVDKLRYINGELSTADVTEGTYVTDWVNANIASSGSGLLPHMTKNQVESRVAEFAQTTPAAMKLARRTMMANRDFAQKVNVLDKQIGSVRADARVAPSTGSVYEARRQRARGTELEAELNTRAMQQFAGVDGLPVSEGTMRFSSILQGANPGLQRSLRALREVALADHGACIRHEAPSPTSLTGLGGVLQEKFGAFDATQSPEQQAERAERMRQYIAQRAHTSVILHEMGHSMGMRHNFVSSSYAWGFRPQYWQLRTKNGSLTTECQDLSATGDDCVGPRWFDPVSQSEHDQLIWMFMQSSIMDYAGEYTQDLIGLGAYDFAAVRMFYGDVVSVFANTDYSLGTARGAAMLSQMDNFGGIIGFRYSTDGDVGQNEIHYSQLNRSFDLIQNCSAVDPAKMKPANWNESVYGIWHPVLDGGLVQVDGQYTRCKEQPIDYVNWSTLRAATDDEAGGFTRGGGAIAPDGRVRVPYGFATDRWADLGNLAVYRHDNGADAYELFNFFISEQEVNHIFDNYRRGRQNFSVRGAVNRTLGRYNEKMRDGAKGLGLFANIYRDFSLAEGYDYTSLWPVIVGSSGFDYNGLSSNVLASGLAFDHFTRQMARPEPGEHFLPEGETVLRAANDAAGNPTATVVTVPNGVTGFWDDVGIGGRPVGNALADDRGEYDSEYTINAGSYYEKVFSTMLLTESVDNFISDSRRDFTDSRYRAVSMADLFPEGYRRWLANNLTNDDALKGSWVRADSSGPIVDPETKYPMSPLGSTTWWTNQAQVCFPASGTLACDSDTGGQVNPTVVPIDPEIGWEQQKFLIAWTLMYLPENQQRTWLDMMSMWSLGEDTDPGFENRIELHDPTGNVYIAKTFGKETIFGKTVQKGVAARMLEYANTLVDAAYVTTPGPDLDNDGNPDWFIPTMGPTGQPIVKYDPTVAHITPLGGISSNGSAGCNRSSNQACVCTHNKACVQLSRYVSVPHFLRTATRDFGMAQPSMKGIY